MRPEGALMHPEGALMCPEGALMRPESTVCTISEGRDGAEVWVRPQDFRLAGCIWCNIY